MSLFFWSATAQSPYHLDWKRESVLLGFGAGTLATSFIIHPNIEGLSETKISSFDRMDINSFDRPATFNYSMNASNISDYFLTGSQLLPFLFLTSKATRKDFGKIILIYGETFLVAEGITSLAKRIVKRPRPFVYNEQAPDSKKQQRSARYSFFSGHTSVTAANSYFAAKVFSDYFPDSQFKPYIWTAAAIIPAVTAYLRVEAGKHFYTDVITGYVVGAGFGFLIPHLHKIQADKALSFYPTSYGLSLTWKIK